ncbi:MAG: YbaB/EbfC family nucleoid-associated protein [Desulfopila sp.]
MDLNNIMQQAQEMQAKMSQIQEQLANKTITGSAGGGMVNVTVNGRGDVLSVAIEDALISSEEKAMLQDLMVAATNDGLQKAKELGKQEMKQLTGGLNIPGLTNMF